MSTSPGWMLSTRDAKPVCANCSSASIGLYRLYTLVLVAYGV